MNKVYTLSIWFLFFFLLQMSNVFSQNLLREDNEWYVLDNYYHVTKKYRLVGDTTINESAYKKLFIEDAENSTLLYPQNLFFREEENMVYLINEELEEQIIYDFSLDTGDTLHYNDCFIEVLSIDSTTLLNNEKRKRLNIQVNYPDSVTKSDSWIEGIGSTSGLFYPYKQCDRFYGGSLDCFYVGTEKIYKRPEIEGDGCWFVLINSTRETLEPPTINIFPNPGTTEWQIESDKQIKNSAFQIFDFNGKIVVREDLSSTPFLINIENLSKGIYYIQIISKDHIYIKKAIKI